MAYLINDNMSVDAMIGYTRINSEFGNSDYDTNRYFLASNLSAFTTDLDKWEIGGHVGFMYIRDSVEAFGGNNKDSTNFAQVKTGIETAYSATKTVQPYLTLDYERDLVYAASSSSYDDSGFVSGVGVRMEMPSSMVGDIHYGKTFGRRDFVQDSFMANMRMNF